ncbi:MAG: hypothetical protein NTX08_12140 [Sphingobacteriales bacterium]|nr:hypothetical protein [Sphingobacteriales bacterium]
MRLIIGSCIALLGLFSCKNGNDIPDVSDIKISTSTAHFEKDLFSIDTVGFANQLDKIQAKYPSFGENFFTTILNCDPKWPADSTTQYVMGFIHAYRNLYDTANIVFKDFSPYEKDIRQGLQFLKYYFPDYKQPQKIITYIGPVDGFGDILTDDAIIVGLHQHLGKNYSLYRSALVQETYPEYISNRFEPDYIAVNAMKNIVLDMYPENLADRPLVQQMVEKGKRLYLLTKLLPYTDAYKIIGYSKTQLDDCYAHEKAVWDLFVQNKFLQTIDNNIIKNYIGDGPKTQELGAASPGNIGSFAGWQIVKKYMSKNSKTSVKELMALDAESIFQGAKYKP